MTHTPFGSERFEPWPRIPFEEWSESLGTLHMITQIVGKIRLVQTPIVNHWWEVALYLTSRGLTTSPIPYGARTFDIELDLVRHKLDLHVSDGQRRAIPLRPRPVADFYAELMTLLRELHLEVAIRTLPNEVAEAVPFEEDNRHVAYDAEAVHRFWMALLAADRVLKSFRGRFLGKASPVHFFWGSFDLAATRFSGRRAPQHPGGVPRLPDWVTREAYSQEVSSCGFWPGDSRFRQPAFYSYAYPEPPGFKEARVQPSAAQYSAELREFVLPYEAVRKADDPDRTLRLFLQSTYDAAAELGHWDREPLERPPEELRWMSERLRGRRAS